MFGSCNLAESEQPLWEHVLKRGPDLWIWGGDNVYGDSVTGHRLFPYPDVTFSPGDPKHLGNLYATQHQQPLYKSLIETVPMVATWDDHDYGINDGDRNNPFKVGNREAFFEFIREPADSPRRQRSGVYDSKLFRFDGSSPGGAIATLPGDNAGGSVLVVLLDLRYNRDPYSTPDGDFLGAEQWAWLDDLLAKSTADVHLIMSSLQMFQSRQVCGESWVRFPKMRQRFLRTLARHNVSAPIILSGDVHFAELGMGYCEGGRLLEVTSSGMTHSVGTRDCSAPNPVKDRLVSWGFNFAMHVMPWRYRMSDASSGAMQYFTGLNFGELEFDWPSRTVDVRIIGEGGAVPLAQKFQLDRLGVGGLGEAGVVDFAPMGGEPSTWRLALGIGVCCSVPLTMAALCALACWRVGSLARQAIRRGRRTDGIRTPFRPCASEANSEANSEQDSDESDKSDS